MPNTLIEIHDNTLPVIVYEMVVSDLIFEEGNG